MAWANLLVVALEELRESLLRRKPQKWPTEGEEALHEHQVLATAITRAVKLIHYGQEKEGQAWIRYFEQFFPAGRNGRLEAKLLWSHWRTGLVKEETPGAKVKVTHGQSQVHWIRDTDGALGINLEDMWGDFEASVDKLIEALRGDDALRAVVLGRLAKQTTTVQQFIPAGAKTAIATASVSSITIIDWNTGPGAEPNA